jgi:mRNA interferase RelE/StbE
VGEANVYRVRVGDYRVVYEVHDDRLLVQVIRVGHRRDVYRK